MTYLHTKEHKMKKILTFMLFVIFTEFGFSQDDATVLNRISNPANNCEIIAFNSQKIISSFSTEQLDSIFPVLAVWERDCGSVEPIQRLKILFDIKNNRFVDSLYKNYITFSIPTFKNRVYKAKNDNYNEIFEDHKAAFSYVPLRSKYDNLTKQFARELLEKQKKETIEYLLCLLFSENIEEFNKLYYSNEYLENNKYKTLDSKVDDIGLFGITVIGSAGIWLPIGKLSNIYRPCPQFGFTFNTPLYKSYRFDFGIEVRPLINDNNIELNVDNTIKSANGTICFTLGAWISNEVKINDKLFLGIISGIGYSRIDTDLKRLKSNSDGKEYYYGVSTYDASLGINISKRVFNNSRVGLYISYHYAPYNNDKLLKTDLGNTFTTLSIRYRL